MCEGCRTLPYNVVRGGDGRQPLPSDLHPVYPWGDVRYDLCTDKSQAPLVLRKGWTENGKLPVARGRCRFTRQTRENGSGSRPRPYGLMDFGALGRHGGEPGGRRTALLPVEKKREIAAKNAILRTNTATSASTPRNRL